MTRQFKIKYKNMIVVSAATFNVIAVTEKDQVPLSCYFQITAKKHGEI